MCELHFLSYLREGFTFILSSLFFHKNQINILFTYNSTETLGNKWHLKDYFICEKILNISVKKIAFKVT